MAAPAPTAKSSVSSMMDEKERTTADFQKSMLDKDTEANILPEVEQEPQGQDVDKSAKEPPKPAPPPFMDPSQFPDGGLEAWTVVLGGWCCLFCSFGWINAIGVFQNYYEQNQLRHLSSSTISWIPSLETFMMFSLGPFIGKAYDNYGPRYILLLGSFLHVFGLMMTSLSTKYYQFILAQGICSPIGASMIFYPAMSAIPTWFFKKRAYAFGVTASGSSIGGVIFPIMVERLVRQVGFGWAMRTSAFLILALMIVANLTVKSRIPPMPKPMSPKEFVTPFTELPYLFTTIACFLFFLGMFLPITYIILQAQYHGMSADLAGYLIPILNATSVFGRILPGFIGDKIGRYNVMIILCFVTAISVLALWLPSTGNAAIIVFAAIYGFGSGAFVSMAPAVVAQISDVRKIGVRTGALFAVISVAALIGNPIGGQLLSKWDGRFTGLQIFGGVVQVAGATFFVIARYTLKGWDFMAKV